MGLLTLLFPQATLKRKQVSARREPRARRRRERFAVVMAGGSGTRFWPRSRRRFPKQLLRITGTRTLLQATVARLRGLVAADHVLIVTHRDHAAEVRRQLPALPGANVLVEPVARNTAPCVALAALAIEERARDASFVCLPADHAIADPRRFRAAVAAGFGWAEREGCSVTIGIKPTEPATGFGYIRLGRRAGRGAYWADAFVEKPSPARARRFVATRKYLWNSGIFVWRVDTLLELFARHLPAPVTALRAAMRHGGRKRSAAIGRAYGRLTPISIDYGLMEKTQRVIVIPGDFGWNDVGSWAALQELQARQDAHGRAPVVAVDAEGYVVFNPERLVALVGVDDLIVVDSPDALLICRRDRAQDVRRVVEELERRRLHAYL